MINGPSLDYHQRNKVDAWYLSDLMDHLYYLLPGQGKTYRVCSSSISWSLNTQHKEQVCDSW